MENLVLRASRRAQVATKELDRPKAFSIIKNIGTGDL